MMTAAFPVAGDTSAASLPRQQAARMATRLGFSEIRAAQAALVVSELATNIARHTPGGQILLQEAQVDGCPAVEVLALDRGAGIGLPQAMRDGYSTAGSMGAGLGSVSRQADQFEMFSQPDAGTVAVARLFARGDGATRRPRVCVAGLSVPKAGEAVCGDAWEFSETATHRTFFVVDGLGHGAPAAEAAAAAVAIFRSRHALNPTELVGEIHEALRATRGAAVAVASLDKERSLLRFVGVGNVGAAIVTASLQRRSLASHNGTVGHVMRRAQEFTHPVEAGSVLVMYTDGLGTQWHPSHYTGIWARDPALAAAALYRDYTRGRDDCTVVVAPLSV